MLSSGSAGAMQGHDDEVTVLVGTSRVQDRPIHGYTGPTVHKAFPLSLKKKKKKNARAHVNTD